MLTSEPTPRLKWLLDQINRHLKPGDRLLFEESGFSIVGLPDPFEKARFSGILPQRTGIELIGGPYLHSAVQNNFTQFGEGRLFGRIDWDRPYFDRYARLYRPQAIACWSPWAIRFCRNNPDRIHILDQQTIDLPVRDSITGQTTLAASELIFARIVGFEGDAIEGAAQVDASAGRLRVRNIITATGRNSGGLDDRVVLRYHWSPRMRCHPPVRIEPVWLEADPVPFIGIHPKDAVESIEIGLDLPP
jgi:hypothetical protein